MATKEFDVLLRDDETPQALAAMLEARFGAVVEPVNSGAPCLTLRVTGTDAQVRGVAGWYHNDGRTRPDLIGKPPVAKGQRRTYMDADDSPHLVPGKWYREHTAEQLVAEHTRRGIAVPVDAGDDVLALADSLNADDRSRA